MSTESAPWTTREIFISVVTMGTSYVYQLQDTPEAKSHPPFDGKVITKESLNGLGEMAMAFTDAEILDYLTKSREKQGLPPTLTEEESGWITAGYSSGAFELVEDIDQQTDPVAA
ncbi:hypothetical protein [Arthrobacter sp. HMWF013]|uniref:hypothetical protein n=1 Tax=Arthrobacter sp. HMWF013 TaxID=2056849 RepID=UPI000D33289E|nr:hypothetical protein [Arthrobacter sp. HMWF013]PTT69227.1 hypothetical protein DBR22_04455 [Arthrobacter sp. HMWF013]